MTLKDRFHGNYNSSSEVSLKWLNAFKIKPLNELKTLIKSTKDRIKPECFGKAHDHVVRAISILSSIEPLWRINKHQPPILCHIVEAADIAPVSNKSPQRLKESRKKRQDYRHWVQANRSRKSRLVFGASAPKVQ